MASPIQAPGVTIPENKNRSDLQCILDFSATLSSANHNTSTSPPSLKINPNDTHPVITITFHASQKWSAKPDYPLTISTRHTPLDVPLPSSLHGDDVKQPPPPSISLKNTRTGKTTRMFEPGAIYHFKPPASEDWKDEYDFAMVPSLESGGVYTLTRRIELDLDSFNVTSGDTIEVHFEGTFYRLKTPGIEWFQWGGWDGLAGKKLGYITDPKLNGIDRDEERKKTPEDMVLPYGCWSDVEDEEGREMVRLEVEYEEGVVAMLVVE